MYEHCEVREQTFHFLPYFDLILIHLIFPECLFPGFILTGEILLN